MTMWKEAEGGGQNGSWCSTWDRCVRPSPQTIRHVSGLYCFCFLGAEDGKPPSWRHMEGGETRRDRQRISHLQRSLKKFCWPT
ncbi:PGC-1 and ERR-induced regulator in muscle protein 1 isoform X2 [Entelurus aequoreus]|uniref:PGC-1 and ERR-induced regulator in muscle protein 1 isoform X2 n=1 Tax=Entelurus aequoreus TaxID=161455 RepID=UPI002B1DD248|nr:PGC-1 and ERR-induced regulator in muscle protein 1 isoform X2 [Entelurus aequoreus]